MKRLIVPILICLLFYGYAVWNWHTEYSLAKPKAEAQLLEAADIAASVVDTQAYESLLSKTTISRSEYESLLAPLVAFHKKRPEIAHVYTASEIGPDLYSILDTGPSLYKSEPNRQFKYETGEIEKINAPDEGLKKSLQGVPETFKGGPYGEGPNRTEQGADIARYIPLIGKGGRQLGTIALTMNRSIADRLKAKANEQLIIELALYSLLFGLTLGMINLRNSKIRRLEEKCEATEEQFRTMVEKMPGAVYIFTTRSKGEKGSLLMLSKGAESLLNITPDEAEAKWKELVDILPQNLREEERGKIRQAKSTMSAWECEFRSPTSNIWVSNKATPKRDESGNTTWFGSLTDISSQKKESEKLSETNEILKQIGEAPDDPLTLNKICEFALGKEDKASILYSNINGKLYPVAGSGIDEELGEVVSEPKEAGTSSGGPAACMVQSERVDIPSLQETQLYSKAEELRTALLSEGFKSSTCYPLVTTDDQCLGVLEILRRNFSTEQKVDSKEEQACHLSLAAIERERNRRTLENNEKRYRTLFETSPIGICEMNEKGEIFYTNPAFGSMVDDDGLRDLTGMSPTEGRREIKQSTSALLAETRKLEKSNGRFNYLTFLSNITEQKQKEEKAISSKELAEAANKAKSEFLAVMSHEIRTPLNGVIGFSQILESMPLNDKEKSFVIKIRQSGETLLSTINDILSLSKIEAGKIDIEKRPFDIRETINSSAEILSPKAGEKNIYIETKTNKLPEAIIGDETRIRQIIINLIGNAVKFTHKGGVNIEGRYDDGKLFIDVIDTGIGISPDNQKKLFQAFSQADSSTTRKYGGTGLGLVICKKLAELMGGHIKLSSKEGVGSTFSVMIPAEIGKKEEESPTIIKPEEDLLPLSILVAEDDEVNRLVITEMLKGLGHEVEFAKNGKEAVALSQELQDWSDLILMDMRMPEMDGLEATREIRRLEIANNWDAKPIFALTANAMEEDRKRCLDAGMTNYISKPIDINILKKALHQCQKAKRKIIDKELLPKETKEPRDTKQEEAQEVYEPESPIDSNKREKEEIILDVELNSEDNQNSEGLEIDDFGGFLEETEAETLKEESLPNTTETEALNERLEKEGLVEEGTGEYQPQKGDTEIDQQTANEEEAVGDIDKMFSEWGFGTDPSIPIDDDIISVETLNACLEILPIERINSVILPTIEENCRKGAEIILSKTASPEEKSNAAHKMCGSLGTFGCISLEKSARAIEAHYDREQSPSPEEGELKNLVEKTLETLRKTIEKKMRS